MSSPLDILAQLTPLNSKNNADFTNENGHTKCQLFTCQKNDSKTVLKKRARAKFIGDTIKQKLSCVHSPIRHKYELSRLCASRLHQEGQKVTSRYCGQRWCIVCSRIRTARAIRGYYSQLEALPELYFLTLTVPNVKSFKLKKEIEQMHKVWRVIINRSLKKSALKKVLFNGIRKLETTYNINRNDYHPHYHLIIDNIDIGNYIILHWLKRFPSANIRAQDIRKVNTSEKQKQLIELFKYSTKFHCKIKKDGNEFTKISAFHLDQIFIALKGKRTYQPFGLIKRVSEDIEELQSEEFEDIKRICTDWIWNENDWFDTESGEALSYYEPSEHDKNLNDAIKLTGKIKPKRLEKIESI